MNAKEAAVAHEHRLANDRYHLTISDDGTGSSHFGALAITRRVPDRTRETDAFVMYVRDLETGDYWSAGAEPVRREGDSYEAVASDGIVTLMREHDGIRTTLEVTLVAGAPAEERRLTIENASGRARRLEVTTYAELVLNTPIADAAHPAFSKLFVQTEWDEAHKALLAKRRLRATDDEPLWVIHTLRMVDGASKLAWETDRMRFIGRGRTTARPQSLDAGAELSGTTGAVLDPIFALRTEVTLAPGASAQMLALLGAGHTREEGVSIIAQRGALVGQTTLPPRAKGISRAVTSRPADRYRPARAPKTTMIANADEPLRFFNGLGGFSSDGTEYVIRLDATPSGLRWPPMPWSNVIANENAGCIVTASGSVTSWTANSRENRLTPWFNDPVSDPLGEAIYLREDGSGVFWSPLPGPTPAPGPYEVRHGFGYTSWKHTSHELEQLTTTWMPRHDPVKIVRLTLRSTSVRPRTITVMSYAHLVLGGLPWATAPHVVTARDASTGAILATNPSRGEFSKRVAFAALIAPAGATGDMSATADRTAFLGRTGTVSDPAALHSDAPLDGRTGAGLDPCAAFSTTLTIPAGGSVEIAFLLGEAEDEARARALLRAYGQFPAINHSLDEVRAFWQETLGGVQIETPSAALDLMVNGWLAYQNLACRMWGRSAYYQSGGAFGFRDQLQDSAALLYLDPSLTRAQIILHASHQFIEGDVLHWWHPPTSKGIRTRFSDDLLWLPYITAFYVASTGDNSVLDAMAPFVTGPQLEGLEDELFMMPADSGTTGSVYEHCCRSIDRSLTAGVHGIPLMGSGDWNDGMNRVGREGKGESVWLGFFLFAILSEFIPLAEARGDGERALRYRSYQEKLGESLNAAGWDGGWYRRAFYDDGTPLGTAVADECRIDAIAQAWSVLSGAAPEDRAEIALDAMEQHLVSEKEMLIRLLTPAFDKTPHDPGYIKGYLPGVRENGGQYTHGVLWGVRALAEMGRTERATRLLEMLSPITHARTPEEVDVYRVEPYVIAADVYGVAPHAGRGGWTWYTGSAGWMYRVALESLLGLTIVGGTRLELRPCVPESWPGFSVRMRLADKRTRYEIVLTRAASGVSETQVHVDSEAVSDVVSNGAASIALVRDGGVHLVEVALANDLTPRYAPASTAP